MPIIPVGEWIPDASALGNPGSIVIRNAVPGPNSYQPFRAHTPVTVALDSRPLGGISVRDKANNVFNYVGSQEALYVQLGASWTDVSRYGGYTTLDGEAWEFVQWKNRVLATNFNDWPQFIDLGGAEFDDLTSDLRGRHIAVVRDHVVFGNTWDSVDGEVPDRVRWSAFNDETDYTVDPATGSDFRDLKAGGWIQRIVGGEFGVIVSERSTFRMTWVGAPVWFQIDEVLPGVGAISPGTVVNLSGTVFFWSEQGIIALTNGTGVAFPGAGKVDRFIKNDLDEAYRHRITGVADARSNRVMWAYPGSGNTGGRPNRIIVYDVSLNRWSLIETEIELLWRASTPGRNLDEITETLEELGNISLDSPIFVGGTPNLAAFNADYEHGFFEGQIMTAVIDTKETEIHAGRMTQLNAFRPVVDGGTVRARVATRNRQTDSPVFGDFLTQTASGRFTTRANARYHRFRLEISGDWRDAIGVQIEPNEARRAGFRG